MNIQTIEKQLLREDGCVYVHSIWDTIQGEGPFAGVPSTFVRLAGCNLRCDLCDTEYSTRDLMSPVNVLMRVNCAPTHPRHGRLVVITGGEPFRQAFGQLANLLLRNGLRVQIETNGTLFTPGPWRDTTIVCSPKTGQLNKKLIPFIKAYKYVLSADSISQEDGLPLSVLGGTSKIVRPPEEFKKTIYVQSMDCNDVKENARHLRATIDSSMRFGHTLCLQLHKMIGMP